MTKRIVFLTLLIILFSINYAYAEQLEVYQKIVNDRVSPGETAEFVLTIRNNRDVPDTIKVSVNELDVFPFSNLIESVELSNDVLKLNAGSSDDVTIKLKVFEDATPNVNYKTFATVRSLTNSNLAEKEDIIISILAPLNLAEITSTFPDRVIAEGKQDFNITIKNKVNKILKNVEVSVASELFQESFKTDLYYGLPFVKTMEYYLDTSTKPGNYTFSIKLYYNKNLRGSFLKEFEVIRNPHVIEKNEMESKFLVDVYKFEKENKGNLVLEESIFLPLGGFARLFTSVNMPFTEKTDEGYKWSFEIKPGEKYVIVAKTDYRALFYGAIIIILCVLGVWYHLHKTILIKKELYHVKNENTGMSDVKIVLKVKNRGSPLRDIRIVDIVPSSLRLLGEYGTLKPSQILSTYGGTKIIWDMRAVDMGDERIISYRLESKHGILVPTTLPPAAVVYKKLNKKLTKMSNKVVFVPKKEKTFKK